MAGSSGAIIIVVMLVICCCCLAALGAAWYENWTCSLGFGNSCSTTTSPSTVPTTPTDPRSAIWATGQKLQGDPLEIGTAHDILFETNGAKPSGYSGSVSYTISLDLNVAQLSNGTWRNIFEHGLRDTDPTINDFNNGPGPNYRRPSMYITPGGTPNGSAPNSVIHYVHSTTTNENLNVFSQVIPIGSWFNITVTVGSGTMTMYMNGAPSTFSVTQGFNVTITGANFTWFTTDYPWVWNRLNYPQSGSVKVANAYFWNSVLTPTQIASLAIPSGGV